MRLLIAISFSLISIGLFAQKGSISGEVFANDKPLAYANVYVDGIAKGTITNNEGAFKIENLKAGKYVVTVSMLGFESLKQTISLRRGVHVKNLKFNLVESDIFLNEVVVSGTLNEVSKLESPVPVEVYKAEFFRSNPTPSLFEGLQTINGVRPQLNCNVCNTGDIHINGLEGPYTMVVIDGMPIVSGLSTVYGLTGIPQALIDRIEVVKGPASSLYGSEAVGGLINIITKNPSDAPLISADAFTTSWLETNVDLGLRFNAGKKAASLVGVNYFNYNNPIDNNGDNFTDVTLQERISVFNKWNFKREENRIFSLAGRYVYEDRWGGEMQFTPEFRGGDSIYGESIQTKRWELLSAYQLPFKEEVMLQISANGHQQRSAYGTTRYDGDQYIGFGQLTWRKQNWNRQNLLMGVALRYTFYDDNTPATERAEGTNMLNNPSSLWLPGLFIQDEIAINDQNKILIGGRYDYNSIHGGIFSPRLNYKWSSTDRKSILRLTLGNGFRVANIFTEDHAALNGARELVITEDLNPETSWNANLNFVQTIVTSNRTFISLDASLFYTHFNNQIIPDYHTDPNKIIYSNLDGFSVSRGFSLNANITLPIGLRINTGFTAMDVFFEENGVRERPFLTERFNAVYTISYPFAKIGLTVDFTGNIYSPMRLPLLGELDPRAPESPWWGNQNIQLTKIFPYGITVYGGVKNILNYTPPANSIARAHDPFDKDVVFNNDGSVMPTPENPYALTFDPTYVFAPNQGIRFFLGLRYTLQ